MGDEVVDLNSINSSYSAEVLPKNWNNKVQGCVKIGINEESIDMGSPKEEGRPTMGSRIQQGVYKGVSAQLTSGSQSV